MIRFTLATFTAFCIATFAARAATPLKVHFISGAEEYGSEPSLRAFKTHLEKEYGMEISASWAKDGATELENIEALKGADVMLVYARRMKVREDQMALIRAHWESGKAIVALRTASHAFQKEDNEVFDRKVMGNNYAGHYGDEAVKVTPTVTGKTHPVLAGVGEITSRKLYKCGKHAPGVSVLQEGDNGKGSAPVSLVHVYKGGRVFYTSLGVREDFRDEDFRRMLVNAINWTARR